MPTNTMKTINSLPPVPPIPPQGLSWEQDLDRSKLQRAHQLAADEAEELRTEAHHRKQRINFKD